MPNTHLSFVLISSHIIGLNLGLILIASASRKPVRLASCISTLSMCISGFVLFVTLSSIFFINFEILEIVASLFTDALQMLDSLIEAVKSFIAEVIIDN